MPLDSDVHNADANLHVRFYEHPKLLVPYVEIMIPGDTRSIIDRKASEYDKARFVRHWLAFQAQSGKVDVIGMPLEVWHQERPLEITDGQLMELQILKFQTVEQVAQASDSQIQRVGMGGESLRVKAIAYIAAKNGQITSNQMVKTNDEVAALKAQLEEMKALLLARPAQPQPIAETKRRGPKPGFKRKVQLNVQHTPATGAAGGQ